MRSGARNRRNPLPFALRYRPTPVREGDGNPAMKLPLCRFPIFPFDLHPVPVLPCTRMSGSSCAALSTVRLRRSYSRWAAAAALVWVVGALPLFAGSLSLAQKHESRHEIDQLEDEWRSAILTGDVKTMDSLLASDFMAITPSGTLQSRDETLENLRSGHVHFTSLTITDRKVRFYGTTAVVTSLANVVASTPDGQVSGNYRYTRVYVRNGQGAWKIVSFEASRVRPPGRHRHVEFR